MKGRTILLVEDDFLNRRVTKKTLTDYGFSAHEAKNAKEALHILETEHIDLIILDINLGEKQQNGIQLSHIIKEKYGIPFIFLTAYENPEIINNALTSAPQSYLTKPFKNTDLTTTIELALRKAAQQADNAKLTVRINDFNKEIPLNDIFYIASEGNYQYIYTYNQEYKIRTTILQLHEMLPKDRFIQIHRAFIVNKDKIEKYNNKQVFIKDTVLPVSRNFTFQFE